MERIVEILQGILQCEEEVLVVDGDSHVNTLGLNSLERIDLICALEREFNVIIPDEKISELQRINDFIDYINKSRTKRRKLREQAV